MFLERVFVSVSLMITPNSKDFFTWVGTGIRNK